MIRNFLDAEKKIQTASHGGEGFVELYEIWKKSDFLSGCDFIDRVVVPPASTVGFHMHGNNEEIYIVLEGRGTMHLGSQEMVIKKGDMIKNPPYGEHGLINDSDENMDLLIIQLSIQ
ncbi:mannose-6-phosphate isomerase-like protein (cupin superfamily) [Hydrogenophaga palleronii]|uniref:Mannose-6-phosphate isomerase-like protein (Cupin superfamily) n=1 Tax=Hydrogenophaga palleronii TaxID=65655 RepID=A0ABU1WK33_9BURK|nr:cupin domain-containing protein [Hydrogenophaga palleronii]MDR7149643.1 mannose-6-phosphate isomerase-like protein (cupin superfamily) [Hydrogenophaga palleronii]